MYNLKKLAITFRKLSQQTLPPTSIQIGDIPDKFPEYFAPFGTGNQKSPLEDSIIQFVSGFLPPNVNAAVYYIVGPGFRPSARTELTTKDGKAYKNDKWTTSINNFVANLMKDMPQKAKQRFPGANLTQTFEFAPTKIT